MSKKNGQMPPVHPGEILREDLMKPLGLTISGLARELKVPVSRLSEIVNGLARAQRRCSATFVALLW